MRQFSYTTEITDVVVNGENAKQVTVIWMGKIAGGEDTEVCRGSAIVTCGAADYASTLACSLRAQNEALFAEPLKEGMMKGDNT